MDTNDYLLIGVVSLVILLPIVYILGTIIYNCLCKETNSNELVNKLENNNTHEEYKEYEEIDIKN